MFTRIPNVLSKNSRVMMELIDSEEDGDLLLFYFAHLNRSGRNTFSKNFSLEQFSESECWEKFRFTKEDIPRLANGLSMPPWLYTTNGLKVSGTEALCIFLRRLAYPSKQSVIAQIFERGRVDISLICSTVLDHIYGHFHQKLEGLSSHPWLDLVALSEAVHSKGCPLQNCIGFIGGTGKVASHSQPSEENEIALAADVEYKKVQVIKFQSIVLPNGIIGHMYGPKEVRRHDCALLRESGILQEIDGLGDFCIYGDQRYPLRPQLIAPFRGTALTVDQQQFNCKMGKLRSCVESGCEEIIRQFSFLDFKQNHKLMQPVEKLYSVGALLTNCHTCLYGNQTSSFFDLDPPSLETYLH